MSAEVVKELLAFILEGIGATLLFLVPGYLLGIAYARGVHRSGVTDREFVTKAVIGALLVHASALAWTLPLLRAISRDGPASHAAIITAWALTVLLILPTLLGRGLAQLGRVKKPAIRQALDFVGLTEAKRAIDAWTFLFLQNRPAYVRVRLKDGSTILGYYGPNSFAASDASVRDLYLEHEYRLSSEGKAFGERYQRTLGVWIDGGQIAAIQFFGGGPTQPIQRAAASSLPKSQPRIRSEEASTT